MYALSTKFTWTLYPHKIHIKALFGFGKKVKEKKSDSEILIFGKQTVRYLFDRRKEKYICKISKILLINNKML